MATTTTTATATTARATPTRSEATVPVVQLTAEGFKDLVDRDGTVTIVWGADWCVPCAELEPLVTELAARHPDVTVATVDTDAEPELASGMELETLPTLTILRDRVLVVAEPAPSSLLGLEARVLHAQALDMDDVRADLEERRHAAIREHLGDLPSA